MHMRVKRRIRDAAGEVAGLEDGANRSGAPEIRGTGAGVGPVQIVVVAHHVVAKPKIECKVGQQTPAILYENVSRLLDFIQIVGAVLLVRSGCGIERPPAAFDVYAGTLSDQRGVDTRGLPLLRGGQTSGCQSGTRGTIGRFVSV